MSYHEPVLLKESVEGLQVKAGGVYVDVTYGGGGHSKAILERLGNGKLVAFDQDEDAGQQVVDDERVVFVHQNFRHLKRYLKLYNLIPVDGILADLGISSHQIDTPERGFSTRYDAGLDMRMDQSGGTTAREVLNNYTAEDLQDLFSKYGEVRNAKTLAQVIVQARQVQPVETIAQFKEIISTIIKGNEHRYLAQVFQALRIEVNREMEALEELLVQSTEVLKEGGRLCVISYHSLEDRPVKNFIKSGNTSGVPDKDLFGRFEQPLKAVNRKPIVPDDEEVKRNPRARSAKLRIAVKQ